MNELLEAVSTMRMRLVSLAAGPICTAGAASTAGRLRQGSQHGTAPAVSRPRVSLRLILLVVLSLAFQAAWAIDIQTAKDRGLVGESNTGYIAAVKTPVSPEVRRLIETVNAKRRTAFEKTANSTTATVEQVRYRFYELAVQRTKSGHYYQDASGAWKKK